LGYGEGYGRLVRQPDGKLVWGGFANNGSQDLFALARYIGLKVNQFLLRTEGSDLLLNYPPHRGAKLPCNSRSA
jgi:hypothetical protein